MLFMIICAILLTAYGVVGWFGGTFGPMEATMLFLVATVLCLVSIVIDTIRSS